MNSYINRLRNVERHIMAYPKFLLLFITFLIAYLLFSGRTNAKFHVFIISLGFFGTFLAGILFTYVLQKSKISFLQD